MHRAIACSSASGRDSAVPLLQNPSTSSSTNTVVQCLQAGAATQQANLSYYGVLGFFTCFQQKEVSSPSGVSHSILKFVVCLPEADWKALDQQAPWLCACSAKADQGGGQAGADGPARHGRLSHQKVGAHPNWSCNSFIPATFWSLGRHWLSAMLLDMVAMVPGVGQPTTSESAGIPMSGQPTPDCTSMAA